MQSTDSRKASLDESRLDGWLRWVEPKVYIAPNVSFLLIPTRVRGSITELKLSRHEIATDRLHWYWLSASIERRQCSLWASARRMTKKICKPKWTSISVYTRASIGFGLLSHYPEVAFGSQAHGWGCHCLCLSLSHLGENRSLSSTHENLRHTILWSRSSRWLSLPTAPVLSRMQTIPTIRFIKTILTSLLSTFGGGNRLEAWFDES